MIFTQRLSDFEILNIGTVIFFVCSFLGMIIREFSYHATAWNLMTKMFFFRYDVDVEIESRHTIQITDVQIVQTSVKIYEDTA